MSVCVCERERERRDLSCRTIRLELTHVYLPSRCHHHNRIRLGREGADGVACISNAAVMQQCKAGKGAHAVACMSNAALQH